jgi:predicted ArsR family transcriptional regulator
MAIILTIPMKTSRQRLLHFLEKKQVATVRDISLALKMTPANARHHLYILIDEGSVEIIGNRVGQGPGRPHKLYKVAKTDS